MSTERNIEIPAEILEYMQMVREGEYPFCKEQIQLVDMLENIFMTETLVFDYELIEKYMGYQVYFPFNLLPWEKFVFVLHNCVFTEDGSARWPDLFVLCGRGAGKNDHSVSRSRRS